MDMDRCGYGPEIQLLFSGGTSKKVTVVSRADEDAFVKAVSAEYRR